MIAVLTPVALVPFVDIPRKMMAEHRASQHLRRVQAEIDVNRIAEERLRAQVWSAMHPEHDQFLAMQDEALRAQMQLGIHDSCNDPRYWHPGCGHGSGTRAMIHDANCLRINTVLGAQPSQNTRADSVHDLGDAY